MLIPVESPDDPRLADYRDIRERDLVRDRALFIAEGKTVLAVLARQRRFAIRSLLLLENRVAGVGEILGDLPAETPAYVVSRATIDQVAGFPMHRGVLAIAERPPAIDAPPDPSMADGWRRVVAASAIANHDNMGALFRNAAAFGADAVILDAASCDPLYRKAIRVSVGGVLTVPFHIFDTAETMLDWLDAAGFETVALSPAGTTALTAWQPARRAAILVGAEGAGLPPHVLERSRTVRIGMSDDFDSLNVATAAGIALHHMFNAKR